MLSRYSSYILCLLVAVFAAILYINGFGPLDKVERSINDLLVKIAASDDLPQNVAIVSIDARSQTQFGKWPWNRDLVADLLAAVGTAGPGVVAIDFPLSEDGAQDSAGYNDILASQLAWVDKTVLSYDIATAPYKSNKTANPKYLFKNSVSVSNLLGELGGRSGVNARKVFLPADKLLASQDQLGFNLEFPDEDMVLRHQPLYMNFDGYYYPSLALRSAAVYLGVPTDQIKIEDGKAVSLGGKRTIPINDNGQYFISFGKGQPIPTFSASEVLAKGFDLNRLKGKAVVVAVDDPSNNDAYSTNVGSSVSSSVVKATVLDNIINQRMININSATSGLILLIMFGLGAAASLLLPRLAPVHRLLTVGGCMVVLLNIDYLLLTQFNQLPSTIYLGFELLLLMIAAPLLDSPLLTGIAPVAHKSEKHPLKVKARKDSSLQPEPAVRAIRSSSGDPENLATAALSSDASGSGKTRALAESGGFQDHQTINPDIAATASPDSGKVEKPQRPRAVQIAEPADTTSDSGPIDTPLEVEPQKTPLGASDLKNLGRYQVTGSLGKGAMGMVYKGIDPAINRPVALKTIRLDFVNDPAELAELKERLFREAQAAGKLSHPNIVTIYDVGSEASLQYIAMEYLEGQTLEELIKRKTKFNYKIIAQMIVQVCSALTYAHERGIVHRDIKPANIMVLKDYSIKVMDFGIARIDSNSMTKTGIAMGTPNYISPEQLKGMPTDRRADLFSLGVVMYELLLGRRPFRGENITSLIYSIMNTEPDKPSMVNPHVPPLFDHVVTRSLRKDPAERYQKATEIVADLQAFVESFSVRA